MKRLTWIVIGILAGGVVGVNIPPEMMLPGLIGGGVLGVLLSGRLSGGKDGSFAGEDPAMAAIGPLGRQSCRWRR